MKEQILFLLNFMLVKIQFLTPGGKGNFQGVAGLFFKKIKQKSV